MHSNALRVAALMLAASVSQAAAESDWVDDYVLNANSQMFGAQPLPSAAPMRADPAATSAPSYRAEGDAVVVTMSSNTLSPDLLAQIKAASDAVSAGKY